jgi:diaminopimelate epimerase
MTKSLAGRKILRMNGIGNEILVLDLRGTALPVAPADARAIARQPGLHFDQLMVVRDATTEGADAALGIYNIDGSLSAACGNGTRCVALALAQSGGPAHLRLETDAGRIETWRESNGRFTVDMGRPRLAAGEIPVAARAADTADVPLEPPVDGAPARFCAVGMGNPHAVFFVPDAAAVALETLGPKLESHPLFPERANISFAQMLSREAILLRVWERGTGATKACGSAACATLVAAARTGRAERWAVVALPGGDLSILWRDDDHVLMTGPAELEFETTLDAAVLAGAAA